MQGEQMISALIGLVGAVSNNGRTEHTDGVIRRAFLQIRNGGSEQEDCGGCSSGKICHFTGLCHM